MLIRKSVLMLKIMLKKENENSGLKNLEEKTSGGVPGIPNSDEHDEQHIGHCHHCKGVLEP